MIKDSFLLALSNLRHRGLRSILTMLGIFIGIAAVVSLITLGAGLKEAITGQLSTLSADRLVIQNAGTGFGPPGAGAIKKLNDHDVKILSSISGVEKVIPRILRITKVEFADELFFYFTGSLPQKKEDIEYLYYSFTLKTGEGKLIYEFDFKKVVIGSGIKKSIEAKTGKEVIPGSHFTIQGKEFEVGGILKETSSFQFNSAIFMLEDDLREIFNLKDEYDFILVQVEDQNKVKEISDTISEKLRRDRDVKLGEEDFSIETPIEALSSINTILNIINLVVSGIAALSLLVGGIGIANTMFTSVLERTREIGTMKAIGAKNSNILSIFLIESGLLGLIGGIIGAILGLSLAFIVAITANSFLGTQIIKVSLSIPLLFASVSFSFVIGIISGLIPAFQGSKLNPVEALRQ